MYRKCQSSLVKPFIRSFGQFLFIPYFTFFYFYSILPHVTLRCNVHCKVFQEENLNCWKITTNKAKKEGTWHADVMSSNDQ